MKALPVYVYKSPLGDSSNGGLSSRYTRLLLVCDDGFVDVDENNPPENLVKMVTRDLGFDVYTHVEPWSKPVGAGWMNGGAIVHTSDSRFSRMSKYPLCLHDRQESWEQYNKMYD